MKDIRLVVAAALVALLCVVATVVQAYQGHPGRAAILDLLALANRPARVPLRPQETSLSSAFAYRPEWEYTQDSADAYEIHQLCNHFADRGWQPVAVFAYPADKIELPEVIGDTRGRRRSKPYIQPYTVLFRRPANWKALHEPE